MTVRFVSRFFACKSRFCFDFSIQGALKELLYCKIRIQNYLKYVALIDEQRRLHYVRHFELPVKNAVLLPPLENLQIRQTVYGKPFVIFSYMATNDKGQLTLLSLIIFSN